MTALKKSNVLHTIFEEHQQSINALKLQRANHAWLATGHALLTSEADGHVFSLSDHCTDFGPRKKRKPPSWMPGEWYCTMH